LGTFKFKKNGHAFRERKFRWRCGPEKTRLLRQALNGPGESGRGSDSRARVTSVPGTEYSVRLPGNTFEVFEQELERSEEEESQYCVTKVYLSWKSRRRHCASILQPPKRSCEV
jgi:hypothetical protein